jgi:hypothetical protein
MNNPWTELTDGEPNGVFKRAGSAHPLDFFWGKDPNGAYMFMFESERRLDNKAFPSIRGISLSVQGQRLFLVLNDNANWSMFHAVCLSLMRSTKTITRGDTNRAVSTVMNKLSRWQNFLGKKKSTLNEKQVKGLIGELLFLRDYLGEYYGLGDAVSFWMGPTGAPQDFSANDIAYEVKCQEGVSEPYIGISSELQLCTQLNQLVLFVLTVGKLSDERENGVSLDNLIESIRFKLQSESPNQLEVFEDRLIDAGCYGADDDIVTRRYLVSKRRLYEVGEGFPRICPETLPEGLEKVRYRVSLNRIETYGLSPHWKPEKGQED